MSTTNMNPIGRLKQSRFTEELCASIESLGPGSSSNVDQIISMCQEQQSSPVILDLMLLRKYEELRQTLVSIPSSSTASKFFETNTATLTGWSAVKSSIFGLRLAAAILSMISFIIMTSTYMGTNSFHPNRLFYGDCKYRDMHGKFENYRYKSVFGMGVVAFAYNIIFLVFYVLPLDSEQKKYVPVLSRLCTNCWSSFARITSDYVTVTVSPKLSTCFAITYQSLECVMDSLVFSLSLLFCILASTALEDYSPFKYGKDHQWGMTSYFTLNSFFATFADTDPPCIDRYDDPTEKIRASLAMMYLSVVLLALITLVSLRSFRVKWRRSQIEYTAFDISSDIKSGEGLLTQKDDAEDT